jgi:glycine C-acetyltransferase
MDDLGKKLEQVKDAQRKLVITDGVFSMEGDLANLPGIVSLAQKYNALVAVDDSHAHGVIGKTGKGTPEYFDVSVDIITGTLGKALGGAAGGFVAGPRSIIEFLVQRSRPQLFSNALPPSTAAAALKAINITCKETDRLTALQNNVSYLRKGLRQIGYEVLDSASAIIPIMVYDTGKALSMAEEMQKAGILVTGFSYPVVPQGQARLRAQVSAAHTKAHLDKAMDIFSQFKE